MSLSWTRLHRILWVRPIWLLNFWAAKLHWQLTSGRHRDPRFVKNRYISGQFPSDSVDAFLELLSRTPTYTAYAAQPRASYVYDETQGKRAQDYNRGREFFQLTSEHLKRVQGLLETVAEPIEAAAGFRWRVVNVIASRESDSDKPVGDREWHYDCFADGAFKVLVYLTGASRERGTTEVEPRKGETFLIEGPPGTWIFFDNNALRHRAIVAQKGIRHLLQVTIAPAFKTSLRPAHVQDGQYPKLPWKPALAEIS